MVDASSAIADHSRKKGKKAGQSETWHRIVERAQIVIVIVIVIIIIIIIITIVVDPMLCEQSSDRNPVYLISSIHPSIAAAAAAAAAAGVVAAVAAAGTPFPGSREKKTKEETCILLLYTCQSRRG